MQYTKYFLNTENFLLIILFGLIPLQRNRLNLYIAFPSLKRFCFRVCEPKTIHLRLNLKLSNVLYSAQ